MYRWMQDHGKKIMAFFGVILMVAFILPTTSKLGQGDRGNPVIGKVNGKEVHSEDAREARDVWQLLSTEIFVRQVEPSPIPGMPPRQGWAPLAYALGGAGTMEQVQAHPDLFLVLLKEAENLGVQVSQDRIESVLQSEVYLRPPAGGSQPIPASQVTNPQLLNNLRLALRDFLRVQGAFDRAASALKISEPTRREAIGMNFQTITANTVEFSSAPYLAKVPAPTPQQIDEQFKKYANTDPANPDYRANPFGFGYRYPDRVKLQYITIPRAAILAAAEKARTKDEKTQYAWKLDAYKYYQSNPHEFMSTPPATSQPSDGFNQLATATKPAPTTRPFNDVVAQAQQKVIEADAEKLTQAIQQRIVTALAGDYNAWKNAAGGATRPATAPATALGAPYGSFDYLKRLADSVQKQFGVLPTVTAIDKDWQTADDLAKLPGIGSSEADSVELNFAPFGTYAVTSLDTFRTESQRTNSTNLTSLLKPSPIFRGPGTSSDIYIYRITDAQAAHAPADKSEVLAKLTEDLRAAEALKLARGDAQKFLDAAKSSSFSSAASAANLKVTGVGPMQLGQSQPLTGYPALTGVSKAQLEIGAFDLLLTANANNPHPTGLIDLPKESKVIAAELTNVSPLWTDPSQLASLESRVGVSVQQQRRAQLQRDWFDYNTIIARTNYEEHGRRATPANPVESQPNPPPL